MVCWLIVYLFIPSLPTEDCLVFFLWCYLCALIYQHTGSFSLWRLPPLSFFLWLTHCYFGPQFFVLEPQVSTRKSKGFAFVFSARFFTVAAAVWQRLLGSWLHFSGLSTVTPTDKCVFFFFYLDTKAIYSHSQQL